MASIFDLCTKQGITPESQNFVLVAGDRAYWTDRLVLCATEAPEALGGPAERWYNRDAVGVRVPWTIVNKKRCEELLAEHSKPESISGDLPVASIEGLAPLWDFVTYTSISAYTNGGGNVCCAIDTIEDFAYFGDADCEKPRQEGESYTEFLKRYALEGVHEQKEIDKVNKMYNRITKYNVI